MRRSYISPEFENNEVYGTFNMLEESNFFGAKMLEIEDSILISNQNTIYYQRNNGEQNDLETEMTLESYIYSSSDDKKLNHTIELDKTQTKNSLENNTKWILNVNLNKILANFLFAELKRWRTFEGIKSDMTIYNDINVAIKNYISLNVLNRYKFKSLDLYINYTDLRNQNVLRYNNIWNQNTIKPEYKFTKYQSISDFNNSTIQILFSQEKPSANYKFDYFFDILFEKL
jgi:hypothetical protein